MNFIEKAKEMDNASEELKKTLQDFTKKFRDMYFGELFKAFFEENPEIHSIQWTQYTPYFNDGDECVFEVNDTTYNRSTFKESSEWDADSDEDDEDDIDYYEGSPFVDLLINEGIYETIKDIIETGDVSLASGKNLPWECHEGNYNNRYVSVSACKRFLLKVENNIKEYQEQEKYFPNWRNAKKNFDILKKTIMNVDSSIMQDAFGDHISVMVTRDGINIEEYSHD